MYTATITNKAISFWLVQLRKFPVTSLDLRRVHWGSLEGLKHLQRLPLTSLALGYWVNDEDLAGLRKMPLVVLDLSSSRELTDMGLSRLACRSYLGQRLAVLRLCSYPSKFSKEAQESLRMQQHHGFGGLLWECLGDNSLNTNGGFGLDELERTSAIIEVRILDT